MIITRDTTNTIHTELHRLSLNNRRFGPLSIGRGGRHLDMIDRVWNQILQDITIGWRGDNYMSSLAEGRVIVIQLVADDVTEIIWWTPCYFYGIW